MFFCDTDATITPTDCLSMRVELKLEEWIQHCLCTRNLVPANPELYNVIAEFTEENFEKFLQIYWGHRYFPEDIKNVPQNEGWQYHCDHGHISPAIQEMVESSHQYQMFLEYRHHPKGLTQ